MERTQGVGGIRCRKSFELWFYRSKLRAAGVDYDVRVHSPYSSYEDFEFDSSGW